MRNIRENRTHLKLLGQVLSHYCGHGNAVRFEDLAETVGCSGTLLRRVAKNPEDRSLHVSFELAMEIVKALPDEAAAEFFAGLGFHGLRRTDGVPACWRRAHVAATRFGHVLATMFADNRIDHREEAELRTKHVPALQAEISRCGGPQA